MWFGTLQNKENFIHPNSMNFARIFDKANPIKLVTKTKTYEATGGFNPHNIVGSRKTTIVYKGCLPYGKGFAIERFKFYTSIKLF